MMLKVHHPLMIFEPLKRSEAQRGELFDFEHLAFFKAKDPPSCADFQNNSLLHEKSNIKKG